MRYFTILLAGLIALFALPAKADSIELACPSVDLVNLRLTNVTAELPDATRQTIPDYFAKGVQGPNNVRLSAKKFLRAIIQFHEGAESELVCLYSRTDKVRSEHMLRIESGAVNCWPTAVADEHFEVLSNRQLSCNDSPEACAATCERKMVMKKK